MERNYQRNQVQHLEAPQLIHSSEGLGWEGLVVRTYDEPAAMELWTAPETTALSLVLVTRGAMQMEQRRLNGPWQSQVIRSGDLLLRPPGRAPYELRWTVCSPEPMQTLHIHVDRDLLLRTAATLNDGDPSRVEVIEQVGFQDALLAQLGLSLGAALVQATPADVVYAQAALQFLVVHLLRHHAAIRQEPVVPAGGLTRRQLQRVTAFAQAHLDEAITLEDLAQQAGYSPYHFARLFRQATGESPYQFVLRQRVARAQQLLIESRSPLIEIAGACGFANQSHMTRIFRQQLGVTPRAYRRMVENSVDS